MGLAEAVERRREDLRSAGHRLGRVLGLRLRRGLPSGLSARGSKAAACPAATAVGRCPESHPRRRAVNPRRGGAGGAADASRARRPATGASPAPAAATAPGAIGPGTFPAALPAARAVRTTRVPHPDGSSRTVPLTRSPSQATAVSGSSLVILISPKDPRKWRVNDDGSLHSAQSSGGDLTRVRLALYSLTSSWFARPTRTPSLALRLHAQSSG